MALCTNETHPGLPSIRVTFNLLFPTCHRCLQFSAVTGPWGQFLSGVPQWDPSTPQETLEFEPDFDSLRGSFDFLAASEVHGLGLEPTRGVIKTPWAGPLRLSWAGLLGWRELTASGQRCRETALPGSSSSAKRSRAEGTARVSQGDEQGRERA